MITKPFTIKHLMPPADSLCLWAKLRWRSILLEEEFRAWSHESFSWHRWNEWLPSHLQQKVAKSIIPECSCFHFCWEQTPTAFMACCSNAKSWWNAEFQVDDRLRPCKHISLEFPSPIFIVGLSTRVGEQPNCDSTHFSGCEFFYAIRLYNLNDLHLNMSDLHSWLSG